jgi:transglutaminase-like putative cysteine protease
MSLDLLHRRLVVGMGFLALAAFAGGAGFEPFSAAVAAIALSIAFFWQPDSDLSLRLERFWLPVAAVLVLRALYHWFLIGDDVVIPVVDLLLLLLCAEALRSLEAQNDARLYSLTFALLLASTAYRPGVLFALAFSTYIVLATLALVVGHLRRKAEQHGVRERMVGLRFLAGMAGLSGAVLLMSGFVFISFPRLSRGWAARGEVLATSIAGFADQVSIGEHGSRIYPNPEIVLRVEFPDGTPENLLSLHWRGRSYDRFDGTRWSRSARLPPSIAPAQWYRAWGPERVRQEIYGSPLDVDVLFALHPLLEARSDNPRIQPLFDNAGDHIYWGSGAPSYEAVSVADLPPPEALREAGSGFSPARRYYTQLPSLPQRVTNLADSLTQGMDNNYDRVAAINDFFHAEFDYTLELPGSAREATLDYFLFERGEGHCEYFSTAMVVLLRSLGIHSREVNGFLGGRWNSFGQYLAVTQNEAHSWVEVWFPGYGWVQFDPTPGGAGTSAAVTSWLWPGRFLFDGLQHRWNKWVLDYNMEAQSGLYQRISEMFGRQRTESQVSSGRTPTTGVDIRWMMIVLMVMAVSAILLLRRTRRLSPEAELYLEFRESCRRAGFRADAGVAPLVLLDELASVRHPAHSRARRLVDYYLRSRFGGLQLDVDQQKEMKSDVADVRRHLRRTHAPESAATPHL